MSTPTQQSENTILLVQHIQVLGHKLQVQEARIHEHREKLKLEKDALDELTGRYRDMGGERILQLEKQVSDSEAELRIRMSRRDTMATTCRDLGWEIPADPEAFAKMSQHCRSLAENAQSLADRFQRRRDGLRDDLLERQKRYEGLIAEVNNLEQHPTNIPASHVRLVKVHGQGSRTRRTRPALCR